VKEEGPMRMVRCRTEDEEEENTPMEEANPEEGLKVQMLSRRAEEMEEKTEDRKSRAKEKADQAGKAIKYVKKMRIWTTAEAAAEATPGLWMTRTATTHHAECQEREAKALAAIARLCVELTMAQAAMARANADWCFLRSKDQELPTHLERLQAMEQPGEDK